MKEEATGRLTGEGSERWRYTRDWGGGRREVRGERGGGRYRNTQGE